MIQINAELRSTETSIAKRLDDLYKRKLLMKNAEAAEGNHRFMPASKEVLKVIQSLSHQNKTLAYKVSE